MNKLYVALGLSTLLACGVDTSMPPDKGPEVLPDLMIPPKPAAGEGLQVITPIFEPIEPSKDYEVCTWTDQFVTEDTDVRSTLSFQNEPPGHHVVVYYTTVTQPPGTQRVCLDTDMATFRFVAGSGGEGLPTTAPGNLVFRIPKGAQIVINHHYLNTTDQVLRGQSAININFAGPGNWTPSGNIAIADSSIDLPKGISSWDIHCVAQSVLKFWYVIPHMHQWGKHITVDFTQSGTKTRLFDLDWDPSFAFHPPEKRYDPSAPMILNPGDKYDVHCEWNNDTANDLTFGLEMCVSYGQTVGTTGAICDAGSWGTF